MRRLQHGFLCLAAAGAALALSSCADRDRPSGPTLTGPPRPPAEPVLLQALECRAEVAARRVTCADSPARDGLPSYLIVGGQNKYVILTSQNVNYDPGTGAFTFDVTVRNLIPQPLGTADSTAALAADANGVRVFFSTPPVATAGSGAITVASDGQDMFLAANQDFYKYATVLEQFEVSAAKTWQFTVPTTVEAFHFGVYVAAAVPWPDGYVVVSGNFNVRSGAERQLTARAYNVVGTLDPSITSFTWSALDSTRAEVSPTGGLVHGQRAGSTTIVATEVGGLSRHGKVVMTVTPIRRTWTGAAGVTDWNVGANWLPDSIAPQPTDTALVPDTTASIFPVLVQNEQVGGLLVLDLTPGGVIPTVDLDVFNLSASGDVLTTNSSAVVNDVGRLFLTGPSNMAGGNLSTITVTGRYSLSDNLILRANTRVVGGRLRSTGFRIRTTSF